MLHYLPGVETTCYVCMVNERDELLIRAALEVAVALAQINVDLDSVLRRRHGVVVLRGKGKNVVAGTNGQTIDKFKNKMSEAKKDKKPRCRTFQKCYPKVGDSLAIDRGMLGFGWVELPRVDSGALSVVN